MSEKPCILLVEYDATLATTLRNVMEERGYHVCFCSTGAEAIGAIDRQSSRLAVLDLHLPDIDAPELLSALRQKSPEAQFIVLANPGSEPEALEAVRAGALDYMTKPPDLERLLLLLKCALERTWRSRMEQLVAKVSRRLGASSDSDLDCAINDVLRLIGEAAEVDRAYLFLLSDDEARMSNTHEWCAPGITSGQENLQDLDIATFPWSMDKLLRGEPVMVPDAQSLDDEASAERKVAEALDIRSMVLVPVMSGQRGEGFLGLGAAAFDRQWDEFELGVLQTAAEIIGAQVARLRAVRELAEREEQLSLVVEGTPGHFFFIRNDKGVFTYLSRTVESVTGRTVKEWMASYETFLTDNPVNRQARKYAASALRSRKRCRTYPLEICHKSGRRVMLEMVERPIVREGRAAGVQGTARDITKPFDHLMAELMRSQKLEAVGALAGGIAHDFKNLLMGISGYAEILQMKLGPDHSQDEAIEGVLNCVDKASKLVGQLLAFSRRRPIDPCPTDLNKLVTEYRHLLERLLGEHISIELDLSPDIGVVKVDPGQIEQVLLNLAINARDAMPTGGQLTISTRNQHLQDVDRLDGLAVKPGEYVELSVADTGRGMDVETRHRIFEAFFTTKDGHERTGLGLSVVYEIVKQHGGHIDVLSEVGEGTTFQIRLPVVAGRPTAEHEAKMCPPKGGSETILLAEDEDTVRVPTKTMLEGYGYTVLCAKDGEEAVELFKQHADDVRLAVLDLVMPKAGGKHVWQAASKMRPDLKVLFISGYTASMLHPDFVVLPDMPFLSKPFSFADLAGKIRELLG